MTLSRSIIGSAVLVVVAAALQAQTDTVKDLSGRYYGPRIGVTYLSPGELSKAQERGKDLVPVLMQFGWQWETRFVMTPQAPVLASSFVLLVGGAEQGVLLPSFSWLLGVRGTNGSEFGVGPVASLSGVGLAIAIGGTNKKGDVYIPLDVVVVVGQPGLRASILTGFNMNRRKIE